MGTHLAGESGSNQFQQAWRAAATIRGWLTVDQAQRLWDEARALPSGSAVVEIGSHRGRSTVILGAAVAGRGKVTAIDPFVEGKLFGGDATRLEFEATLANTGLADVVTLVHDFSTRVRPGWEGDVSLVYVDGKHDYWTCSDDLRWARALPPGGAMLVHDAFSSVGVTTSVLVHLLPSRTMAYEGRTGSLATFRRRRPTIADRWRIVAQLPWWVRNLALKVLLRLRARTVARWLGHAGSHDPF